MMDKFKLFHIDEQLESSEVAALCFLCRDVVNRKRLEGIKDAKGLFLRLEENGLMNNSIFLSRLLHTIHRMDLLSLLETDSRQAEEADACPILSEYRVMLYKIYEELTQENLKVMKFVLSNKLPKRLLELSNTALDVFVGMERAGLLSHTNVDELHEVVKMLDQSLALTVQNYKDAFAHLPHVSMDVQMVDNTPQPQQPSPPISETRPNWGGEIIYSDAQPNTQPSSLCDQTEYYTLTHEPRGLCVVINNEIFNGPVLANRGGTQEDAKTLRAVFSRFGFEVVVHNNLTAKAMRHEIEKLGSRNFLDEDALVVCVLSHGDMGCVFGTDEGKVLLRDLTRPFTSGRAPTLAGKPKLFFIQACQGEKYQTGTLPCPPRPGPEGNKQTLLEEDAGRVYGETIPADADFLLGMATVQDCKSFRNVSTGSIYIQELCKQLMKSAESSAEDDILSVLTRVNREVSRGVYRSYKQMPEPKYTLTKKLVLRFA